MLVQIGGFLTAGSLLAVAFIQWSGDTLSLSPVVRSISGTTADYASGSTPSFEVKTSDLQIAPGAKSVDGTRKGEKGQLVARVVTLENKPTNLTPSLESGKDGALTINVPQSHAFPPGKYRMVVESTKGNKTLKTQQDFTWGVLAVNLDKSTYRTGETANLGLAVLDDKGTTVCDAKIDVIISDSRGREQMTT